MYNASKGGVINFTGDLADYITGHLLVVNIGQMAR